MPEDIGELQFEVDARHVLQLGRELVADKVTAVSELVKNAYDADATTVNVTFRVTSDESSLTIVDDGEGMDLDDVRTKWMRISTPFKDEQDLSRIYCRRRAGQKGIGRFAVETLGAKLELSSTKRSSPERVRMTFDWSLYSEGGTRIDAIRNPFKVEEAPMEEHGTELRILELHDQWQDQDLRDVRRAVLLLQPPFPVAPVATRGEQGCQPDPGFRVEVVSDLADDSELQTLDALRASATAFIEGTVGEYGRIEYRLTSDRFDLSLVKRPNKRIVLTGPFSFTAYYYVWARDALGDLGSLTQRQARDLANEFGGIRLYRDSLRILPYGEQRNDWLGLDALYRQRSVLYPVAKNNFFGEVHITREDNPSLIDTASREGVVEGPAFHELRDSVRQGLVWAAGEVASVRQKKKKAGGKRAPVSRSALVEELVGKAETTIQMAASGQEKEALEQFEASARSVLKRAATSDKDERRERELLVDEIDLLRILSSLGASMAVFSHEVRGAISAATGAIDDLADVAESLDEDRQGQLVEYVERATAVVANLHDISEYIDLYVSRSRRRNREQLPVKEVVRDFVERFRSVFARAGVAVTYDVEPAHLRTGEMARSELDAILFNLVTNAMKALDREGLTERSILVAARPHEDELVLQVMDTGSGIDPSVRDRMFEPFVTTTDHATVPELGVGTGLGLKIVADIARAHRGDAGLGEPRAPFATCVEVHLPRSQP